MFSKGRHTKVETPQREGDGVAREQLGRSRNRSSATLEVDARNSGKVKTARCRALAREDQSTCAIDRCGKRN